MIDNTKNILESYNINICDKMLKSINIELINRNKKKDNTSDHVCFIIDYKSKEILSYSFNIYYKSDKFPFSIHSEINTITKYYKTTKLDKNKYKSKKFLVVLKITKSGKLSSSKPCQACANYINNNVDNLNLMHVYYSTEFNDLAKLEITDLQSDIFRYSSGRKYNTKVSKRTKNST